VLARALSALIDTFHLKCPRQCCQVERSIVDSVSGWTVPTKRASGANVPASKLRRGESAGRQFVVPVRRISRRRGNADVITGGGLAPYESRAASVGPERPAIRRSAIIGARILILDLLAAIHRHANRIADKRKPGDKSAKASVRRVGVDPFGALKRVSSVATVENDLDAQERVRNRHQSRPAGALKNCPRREIRGAFDRRRPIEDLGDVTVVAGHFEGDLAACGRDVDVGTVRFARYVRDPLRARTPLGPREKSSKVTAGLTQASKTSAKPKETLAPDESGPSPW
jgi:hypothetical protein